MKKIALSTIKANLPKYLEAASAEEIVIMRDGRPAGVLIGFRSQDDWFDYRLERDRRFLKRVSRARAQLRAGKGVRLEDVR